MINEQILVVSGLPRSGTSMMMQLIATTGISIVTDEIRSADISNPKGYYEYEPVKKLMQNNSWMPQIKGKCVKIIAQLIPFMQPDLKYKIIFMKRDIDEVLTSQNVMLGKKDAPVNPVIKDTFQKQLEKVYQWMQSHSQVELLEIDYKDAIEDPEKVAKAVNLFLGGNYDEEKMKTAISPDLYRNRKS